jgi:hypothetical protein
VRLCLHESVNARLLRRHSNRVPVSLPDLGVASLSEPFGRNSVPNSDGDETKSSKKNRGDRDSTVTGALIARRGTILVALISVVGAVVVAVINLSGQPAKGAGDQGASTGSPSQKTAEVQQEKAPADSASGQVKLDAGMGVDLDEPNPKAVPVSGANGDIDLYFDGSSMSSNRLGLSYYYGSESGAQAQCPKVIADGDHVVPGPAVDFAGGQSCLRTSKGVIGWISVNDVKRSANSSYEVLNYKLFH